MRIAVRRRSPWWPAVLAVGFLAVRLSIGSPPAAAQVPFDDQIVDAQNSGDDKAVADIDGDGWMDGIIGGSVPGTALVWYRSDGPAHGFTRFVIRANPVYQEFSTDMEVADVDGDGDIDLVLGDGGGGDNVLWFENPRLEPPPGTDPDPTVGSNWLHHVIGTHGQWAHDFSVGDLDRDGKTDVVTSGHGRLHLWFQDSPTVWTGRDLSGLAGAGAVVADVDDVHGPDLFAGGAWLEAPSDPRTGTWTRRDIPGSDPGDGPASLGVDIDRDGLVDLVTVRQHTAGQLAWYEHPLDPVNDPWIEHAIAASEASHHLKAADFDGNGFPDLLIGHELTEIAIYLNDGSSPPTFVKQSLLSASGHNAVAGDIDGNGTPDVWACDFIGNPPVRVLWNLGPTIFADGFESGDTSAWSDAVP